MFSLNVGVLLVAIRWRGAISGQWPCGRLVALNVGGLLVRWLSSVNVGVLLECFSIKPVFPPQHHTTKRLNVGVLLAAVIFNTKRLNVGGLLVPPH